ARNLMKLLAYLAWTLGFGGVILIAVTPPAIHTLRKQGDAATFFALWLLPALAFNVLIHMTEAGHAIWHLPVLYLLLAIGLQRIVGDAAARGMALISAAGILQFCLYPWSVESRGWKHLLDEKTAYMSRSGLRQIDRRKEIHKPGDFWPTKAHETPD